MVALGVVDGAPMVHDIVILAVGGKHTVMAGAGADAVVSLQDLDRSIGEGAGRRGPSDIADAVGVVAPSAPLARPYPIRSIREGTYPPTLYIR